MRRSVPLLVALLAFAGCGGSDEPEQTPEAFVTTLIRQLGRGQSAAAWEALHPGHRERVPRQLYVRCEQGDGFGGEVTKIEVLEVKPEPWTIPGGFGERPSTSVTVGISLKVPDVEVPERVSLTAHVFEVEGGWSWVIGPVDFASYMRGRCPP